ncbi:IS3 family transposase [uncultured Massilia sp.]|uniref:IS3 family transposase n=1 Tax=uncultured Massilia sp. TaxID=169973 RepID=UPI0035A33BBC
MTHTNRPPRKPGRFSTYGSPRVGRDLIDAGFACSKNRVPRLTKAAGINARHNRRRAPGQLTSPVHAIAPNLRDLRFEATGPKQKWSADFTYVWTGEGWLFVAGVLDLYSWRLVGFSMQSTTTAQLIKARNIPARTSNACLNLTASFVA